MAQPRFYHCPLACGSIVLSPGESVHAAGARRLRTGDAVTLFDGQGGVADAVVAEISPRKVVVEALACHQCDFDLPVKVTLRVAIPKQDRQQIMVEKCTELGVWALGPARFSRSVATAQPNRLAKWRRTAVEAAKQSGRAWLPNVLDEAAVGELIGHVNMYEVAMLADLGEGAAPIGRVLGERPGVTSVLAIVGPEGGLAADEVEQLVQAGAVRVCLAPTTLRIETAAVAFMAVVAALRGSR